MGNAGGPGGQKQYQNQGYQHYQSGQRSRGQSGSQDVEASWGKPPSKGQGEWALFL